MPFPPDFETYASSRLFIKAGRPTDDTETAWETFFATGGLEFSVTQVGVVEGRQYNTSELDVVSQGLVRRKLGNYQLPDSEWGILETGPGGDADTDAYDAARTAMQTRAIASFAVVRQSGAVLYLTAQVMNLAESGGGSNDSLTYSMSLLFQSEALKALTPDVPNTP